MNTAMYIIHQIILVIVAIIAFDIIFLGAVITRVLIDIVKEWYAKHKGRQ